MDVNREAPVVASASIEVDAGPNAVWAVLSDIEQWPAWNPDVKEARLDGPLAEGTAFRWKAGPLAITSVLRAVEEPHTLGWTGRTMGIGAVHVYRLSATATGTEVTTEESWEGLLVSVLRPMMRRSLQESIEAGLRHLKAEAERPVAG